MSLVADYSGSSDSDTDSNTDDKELGAKNCLPNSPLPSATILLSSSTKTGVGVFNNPYLAAECTKQAALEQHVKMIKPDEYIVEKNGKKICWNNRRGRCRYGNKCQYAHDSDLVQKEIQNNANNLAEDTAKIDGGVRSQFGKRKQPSATGSNLLPNKRTATDNS